MNNKKIFLTAVTLVVCSGFFNASKSEILSNKIYSNLSAPLYFQSGSSIIENIKFYSNTNQNPGATGGSINVNGNATEVFVKDSDFANNTSDGSVFSFGGAIYNSAKNLTVENSNFNNNSSINALDGSHGGAIFTDGDSMPSSLNATLTVNNSTFTNNFVEKGFNPNIVSPSGMNAASGGAIASQFMSKINVNNSVFTNNYAISHSESNTTKFFAAGGAIAATYVAEQMGTHYRSEQTLNVNNSEFYGNYAQDTYKAYGGAIGSLVKFNMNINNSIFDGNYLKDTAASKGGAISSLGSNSAIDIKNSQFINNYITNSPTSYGGAIYTQLNKINIENTDFINNHITNATSAYGGAIADVGSTITLKNSSFINNSVQGTNAQGGAIFFQGNGASTLGKLNIIADGKDVKFSGNTANGASNSIYQGANSILSFNINKANSVTLDDYIYSSSNNVTMNINEGSTLPTGGLLVLNANMNNFWGKVNFYNGTIQIGENGTFFKNASAVTMYDGTTINSQNQKTDTIIIKNLNLNGTTNVKIDADLANEKIDTYNILSATGSGKLNITSINLTSELIKNTLTKDFITGANVNTALDSSAKTILTQSSKYDVSLNNNALTFDRSDYTGGLAGAVALGDSRQYQMADDEIVKDWATTTQNEMQGDKLVVDGGQNSVTGLGNEGIKVTVTGNIIISNVGNTDESNNITKSWNGFSSTDGGAINNLGGTAVIVDSVISNNQASNKGGAVHNDNGTVNIIANNNNVIFKDNTANKTSNAIHNNGGTVNFNASSDHSIIFHDSITSENNSGEININASKNDVNTVVDNAPTSGTVVLNNDMSGYKGDVNLYHGTIKVAENGTFFNPENFHIYGCTLDFANNKVQNYNLGNLTITDHVDMLVDADLAAGKMDTISANNTITDSGKINVSQINLLSDANGKNLSLNFTDANLRESVIYSGKDISYSPIYKYSVAYDKENGNFDFERFGAAANYDSFNPSVFVAPVAAQIGGYLTQLNAYDQAFMNIDMRMLMTRAERNAYKLQNKFAAATVEGPLSFSPTYLPEEKQGAWVRPYTAFEKVNLRGGVGVSNVMYGTFLGADTDMFELGHGFEGQYSLYAGYNGSHQAFGGNSLYQNGGTLGLTGAIYKGNFFSALTANTGANNVEASTMYGSENFPMLMAGVASKTGYNWELADGKFIIQPNYLMSYTFVNAYSYTNASGVRITSDPLNAIQIAPGIKFIGNLKNGWQPYASISMVWNLIDATKFQAANVSLPELSVKPYIEYGVGVQKRWGERFTGYFQTMIRNGGRNGVALSLGLRWTLGKAPQTQIKQSTNKLPVLPTSLNLSCNK